MALLTLRAGKYANERAKKKKKKKKKWGKCCRFNYANDELRRKDILDLPVHSAPGASQGRVADVNVALDGECEREPDGRRVEQGRNERLHEVVTVAGFDRFERFHIITEGVQVEEPRSREE